ncbi:hypothetical protein [Anaerotignum sp.]|uniref:hypothetical protein n=1 Tax=Anaerotignum sp. TaxID=2039241 RepID=UPI00332FEED6
MAKEKDLKLLNYDISDNRYRELKYFCRQYREKKEKLSSITELSSAPLGMKRGGVISDRTANIAIKKARLSDELRLIEQAAMETDGDLYGYILESVTDGIPYEYLDIPTSRSGFYALRRRFFYILDQRR